MGYLTSIFIVLALVGEWAWATPLSQSPLHDSDHIEAQDGSRKLHGRFLHITDFHPDPHYRVHSSTDKHDSCHHELGLAGIYGAETTKCDSPLSLINATMKWVEENLKGNIDFVIWTGDSARHDNDPLIPRSESEVLHLNRMLVAKFVEVFGKEDHINDTDPTNDLIVPIVPTFGNNDMMPHNIFANGPNRWTKTYLEVWEKMIPEEQRHGFERGGWFFVEVIPNKLAVFSLNTMYFFGSNSAVDGCAPHSEPGYEQFEWLRIQLEFLRQRGMKAILTGHVPPARTEFKRNWDETCWQKYALWIQQYRDVVAGSLYGHMNHDHFILQDFKDIKKKLHDGISKRDYSNRDTSDDLSTTSAADYLMDLRDSWAKLPDPPAETSWLDKTESEGQDKDINQRFRDGALRSKKEGDKQSRREMREFLDKIGGPWGERYGVSLVSPSVVPNYFPTLRVIEYNISGLDAILVSTGFTSRHDRPGRPRDFPEDTKEGSDSFTVQKSRKKKSRPKKPDFIVPEPPSKSSPPGPAYSPQTFTFLGYTQYFANLTHINNEAQNALVDTSKKHKIKQPHDQIPPPHEATPNKFEYKVEYSTFEDKIFKLRDMTVRSYLDLAIRIGHFKPRKGDSWKIQGNTLAKEITRVEEAGILTSEDEDAIHSDGDEHDVDTTKKKHKKKKKHRKHRKHKHRKAINKVWFTFVKRAFVGSKDDQDIHDTFGQDIVGDKGVDGLEELGAGGL